jgi:coniferyl-aldehyde dehydrogenase
MGHYHGFEGFQEFSKMRPVHTNPKVSGIQLFYPPYGKLHGRLFDLLLRFKR